MRVEQAVGALEADRQAPTLATEYRWPAKPAQLQPTWQLGAPRVSLFKLEPHHAPTLLGQPDHPALQPHSATIKCRCQAIIQRLLRRNTRPAQSQQEQAQ
ncbi:hypothetical protein D3C80_1683200 [compost metagenome]